MNAIVVRSKATGKIVACGPSNGLYDPGFDPLIHTKGEEPDYTALITQHLADLTAIPNPRQVLLDALDSANTLSQVKSAVKELLK